jgi:hypothetical protein
MSIRSTSPSVMSCVQMVLLGKQVTSSDKLKLRLPLSAVAKTFDARQKISTVTITHIPVAIIVENDV